MNHFDSVNPQQNTARDRIVRLFQFVAAYHEQRNPPTRRVSEYKWSLRFAEIPAHEAIDLTYDVDLGTSEMYMDSPTTQSAQTDAAEAERVLVRVRRPKFSTRPKADQDLEAWLGRDWQDCTSSPAPQPSRNVVRDGETLVAMFEDDATRVEGLARYRIHWNVWAKDERVTLAVGKLFEALYELHGTLELDAETYELVIADGLLVWERPDGGVRHPLLFRAVRLDFDPEVPEFRIVETGAATEFYTSLFRSMDDVDGNAVGRMRTEIESLDPHPLGLSDTDGFLRMVSTSLSAHGEFVGADPIGAERGHPVIARDPAFILRRRTAGIAKAIAGVVEDAQNGGELSLALHNVVGIAEDSEGVAGLADSGDAAGSGGLVLDENTDESVLFTKPANRQQLEIAHRLERESCVLVQGPPGTGKTHTIANLIGHLLATGKTVLVTSHTTKALKVLREKVVPQLQPLCLSVLDSKDDDAALKSSIDGIVDRLGSSDSARLERDVAEFEAERRELIEEVRVLQAEILDARMDERRPIVLAGASIAPLDAAKEIALGRGVHNWIPSPVTLGDPLPLASAEIAELYATNASITVEDEEVLQDELPDLTALPIPEAFAALVAQRRSLSEVDMTHRIDLWRVPSPTGALNELDAALERVRDAICVLTQLPEWILPLAELGRDAAELQPWQALLAEVEAVRAEATSSSELVLTHAPTTAKDIAPDRAAEVYEAIAADVRQTGKPPGFLTLLTRPEWKRAIEGAFVSDGAKIRLQEHFDALAAQARLSHRRESLRRRWRMQVEAIGGPSADGLGDIVEVACRRYGPVITAAIDWWPKTLQPAVGRVAATGFLWDVAQSEADAHFAALDSTERVRRIAEETLPLAFAAERARREWIELDDRLANLDNGARGWPQSRPALALRKALEICGADAYRKAYLEIDRLSAQTRRVGMRFDHLKRLERAAPDWAGLIRARAGVHGSATVPGDPTGASRWRQLEDELNYRDRLSLPSLSRRLESRRGALRERTAELADCRAWRAQVQRTSHAQRQALMGFAAAKKRIGKGTGKRAATYAKMAREQMSEAREAVPVWIMPIVQAAEVFDPRKTRFDVVIVDESSQCEVTGLIAAYLGRQVVIVGDDEQVSPSAVGEKSIDAQHLIDAYLQGIPNKQLYDGRQSLYDIAKQSFGGALCLLEHFRCVPDIIRFSNALSYNGAIKPLRESSSTDPAPAVVAHRVSSAGTYGRVNDDEAAEVASLVVAAIEQPEYRGKSFGIISMVGDEQAYRIESMIRNVLPPAEVERRRLLSGSSAQFQGDERDVMFLSMVDAGDGTPLRLDRETKAFQQRFNVAASRARDQMWVVYSLDPSTELKTGDIRRRLIEHALDPMALARSESVALQGAESPFEAEVIRCLSAAGYRLTAQHQVGAYRIDIVVHGVGGRRLAVECDGDRYHRLEDLQKDIDRQTVLERIGWTFARIRGSRFYREPEHAMQPVFERLREMGIEPLEHDQHIEQRVDADDLLDRVRARAVEIRNEVRASAPLKKKAEAAWGRQLRIVS